MSPICFAIQDRLPHSAFRHTGFPLGDADAVGGQPSLSAGCAMRWEPGKDELIQDDHGRSSSTLSQADAPRLNREPH